MKQVTQLLIGAVLFSPLLPSHGSAHRSARPAAGFYAGKFYKLPVALQFGRSGHSAEVLPDGRILIAGGAWAELGGENSAEIFDTRRGTSKTLALPMSTLRSAAAHVRRADGRSMFIGGSSDYETAIRSTDVYDAKTNTFSAGADMIRDRSGHTAISLADGRIVVIGGTDGNYYHDSIEIWDPTSGKFHEIDSLLTTPRAFHSAILVNEKTIAIIGGESGPSHADPERNSEFLDSIELLDVATLTASTFEHTMNTPRIYHSSALLADGRILISGGLKAPARSSDSLEILDVGKRTLQDAGAMLHRRALHTLTGLSNGTFLVAGGVEDGQPLKESEICSFAALSKMTCSKTARMSMTRWMHSANLLPDGKVLFVGGLSDTPEAGRKTAGPLHTVEIFSP
ncbi:MAG: hypothetical protein RLZZ488_648 [Pseudomonadota bacterium]